MDQFGSHPYCGGVLSRLAYRYAKQKGLDADKLLEGGLSAICMGAGPNPGGKKAQ